MTAGAIPSRAALAEAMKRSRPALSNAMIKPGLVQNCPTPRLSEATNSLPNLSARSAKASGNNNTGLMLLISAYTGIGSGRSPAIFIKASPPAREPVNPTALTKGCATKDAPSSFELPLSNENTPGGNLQAWAAATTACATNSLVPG